MKWLDTFYALIFPGAANVFGVFLLRQFFQSIPSELEEAAIIDGASYFQRFWNVILPLSSNALVALGIFVFLGHYNDLFWPFIVTNTLSTRTLPVGLAIFKLLLCWSISPHYLGWCGVILHSNSSCLHHLSTEGHTRCHAHQWLRRAIIESFILPTSNEGDFLMEKKNASIYIDNNRTISDISPLLFSGFAEHMGRCIYEGIYDPASPHADGNGLRTDVLNALRELNFRTIRYPGGNFLSGYRWEDGIGSRQNRPIRKDLAWQSIGDKPIRYR
ncbi:MAG UNVERIFIED_CONTAM: ABC transporter permease subunit [Anaerolineae bacterium]